MQKAPGNGLGAPFLKATKMNEQNPEFSRIISIARIPPKGVEEALEAKPSERAALAKRFDLFDLTTLKAKLTLTPGSQDSVTVKGKLNASYVQNCVVTLEPLTTHLDLDIDVTFFPSEGSQNEADCAPDELDEEFESFSGGKIDLGELVAQQLGVNIDHYPRQPDAILTETEFGAKLETEHPFATLSTGVKTNKNKAKAKKKP
jgi:uncharacterized metal-binding protein YceD (DUF177 family)